MAITDVDLKSSLDQQQRIVNDFQIRIATANGTGSLTSNTAIMRALFWMGIPVNGKNIFPSNIQGLPTWFTIRLSKDGYTARRHQNEISILMNMRTQAEDIADAPSGGIILYPENWGIKTDRDDLTYYQMPLEVAKKAPVKAKQRDYVANMVYVGVLAHLIDLDLTQVEAALSHHFGGREKLIKINMDVIHDAYDWAVKKYPEKSKYKVEPMQENDGLIILDGNAAAALGSVFGGINLISWYPITPSTSIADAARTYMKQLRHDEDGKATYAIIQAEDELAAIGMVIGASWAGARSMTATSGPGISLMSEFAGMAYLAEVPAIIWDVQRMGPSTGLPTRVSQGDVMAAYFLGHGDSKHVVLLPGTIAECFEFGWRAPNLADQLQTLIFVLSDLDLGMNLWMSDPFEYPTEPIERGKVLDADDLDRIGDFARYRDTDGDGVSYRTLPGTDHPNAAFFTRGTGKDEYAVYSEKPEHWIANLDRLARKHETARGLVPQPIVDNAANATFGIISYGTNDPAIEEGRDMLKAHDVVVNYMRLRALPLAHTVRDFIEANDYVYVIENNYDGQMAKIIQMEYPELAGSVKSLSFCDGLPLTGVWVKDSILEQEGNK